MKFPPHKSPFRLLEAVFAIGIAWSGMATRAAEAPVDFDRDIRPILSDQCFHCHGPDAKNQKSEFRLDTKEHLFADLGGYFGVKPGSLEDSELHWRIRSDDPADQMPPPDSNRSLTSEQKDLLDRWIREGAPYAKHWSFEPPVRAEAPEVRIAEWNRNPVDRFILAKLEREGLKPTPKADRETLLRRASLALTGLPPTPAQVDAFLADESEDAWAKQIDRLLDSMDYAERQTLLWLDAARYADTDGFQNDAERSNWPWRDWVIRSFRDNQPFDQFTIEQLAGDMLENATNDQILASAFNRNHRQNSEGGALAEEFFVENVIDRVETTSTVWLGLTMGCARCHDHKYDPITQREFYQLFAYFNNIGERGTGKGIQANPVVEFRSPLVEVPEELSAELERASDALESARKSLSSRFDTWLTNAVKSLDPAEESMWKTAPLSSVQVYGEAKLEDQGDGSWKLTGPKLEKGVYNLQTPVKKGDRITAISLEALADPTFSKPRQLSRSVNGNFVLTDFKVLLAKGAELAPVKIGGASATYSQDGYPIAHAVDEKKNTGWAIYGKGENQASSETAFFVFSPPIVADEDTTLHIQLRHESGFASHNIGRLRIAITDVKNPELRTGAGLDAAIVEALQTPIGDLTKEQMAQLRKHHQKVDPELAAAEAAVKRAEAAIEKIGAGKVPVMVMREADGDRRPAYFLHRGQYTEPDLSEPLPRAVPASLLSESPGEQPRDRLELARWLVSPENPLTARVIVNRAWQSLFGTGIVKTTEDFGLQGEVPTHPELLDWLAVEFRDSGWDLKALFRLILTSETFQQGSMVDPTLLSHDPENRLLARGPRYRLDGFAIRDGALQAAGLLNREAGGPPVKPYQPPGLWNAVNQNANFRYNPSQGDDLYRKSLYTYWKRAVNPPRQIIFDAAGRETCNVRRRSTNTPLQALALMNDETFLEAARRLATRTAETGNGDAKTIVSQLYRNATAHRADEDTVEILTGSLAYYREHFGKNPEAAKAFLTAGDSPVGESLDPVEHAARTAVAHLVLNLDETITLE